MLTDSSRANHDHCDWLSDKNSAFLLISKKLIKISIPNFMNIFGHHVKHQKREPEGVHRQLEGCNRNLRPKAAVAKVYTHGKTTTIWH